MAEQTFRINVVISADGARAGVQSVERDLKKLDSAASNTQRLLKRAFTLIGIEEGIRAILGLVDAYTKLQNRIRVVVQNNEILGVVTQRVFDIANRSRSSFESTAELFSRMALATRDLGVSENELLGVTESMNKAIILSGASAKEANNGLIQLSQGIASNRLGGDELRAVLEQLPVVADVIAKQLGIARGQLRLFSRSGNIDAKTILDAFKNAREELEGRFLKTIPTLSQAFQLLRNNLVSVVGDLATTSGAATLLAQSISFLARNLETLVRLFVIFGTTLAAVKLASYIQRALAAASAAAELRSAVAAGNAVLLGSAEATRQIAAFDSAAAFAKAEKTAATVASIVAEQANTAVMFESTAAARGLAESQLVAAQAEFARARSAVAVAESEQASLFASVSAVEVLAGAQVQSVELTAVRSGLTAATAQLTAAQASLNTVLEAGTAATTVQAAREAQLVASRGALAAETAAFTASQARLATAEAAAIAQTTALGRASTTARTAISALWATIAANPIGAALILIAALGTALFVFRNDIALSGDGFATLGDLTSAYFDLFNGGLDSIQSKFGSVFGFIGSTIDRVFGDGTAEVDGFLRGLARVVDFFLGPFVGAINAGITQFLGIGPALGDLGFQLLNTVLRTAQQLVVVFRTAFNTILDVAERFFGTLKTAFSGIGDAFEAAIRGDFSGAAAAASSALVSAFDDAGAAISDIPATFSAELDAALADVFQVNNPLVGEARALGENVAGSFMAGFQDTATLDFVNQLLEDANDKARERREAAERAAGGLNTKGLALPTVSPVIAKITRELQDQQALLSLTGKTNAARKVESDLLKIKNELITQGAAAASQQISQIDQQISQLRQKLTLEDADVALISKQVLVLQNLRQSVQEKTKADVASFDATLEGFRVLLLQNDALQAMIDVVEDLRGQQEQVERSTAAATAAFTRGVISADEYERALRRIAESGRTPVEQVIQQVEQQSRLLAITAATNTERELAITLEQQVQQLAAQGEVLTEVQEEKLRALNAQNLSLQRQRDLVENVPLTQAAADAILVQMLDDLAAAYERGELSVDQWTSAIEQANQSTLTLVGQLERDIQQQNALLLVTGATNAERIVSIALLQEEQRLKNEGVTLGDDERATLQALIEQNQALQRQQQLLESITPTADKVHEQYLQDLADVDALQKRGALSTQQYAQALEDLTLRAAEAGNTLEDGFTRAGIKITNSIQDMASVTESSLTSAFNSAEQALNDFATNGTVDVRALAQSLVADFTKVISHLLILQATEGLGIIQPKAGTGLDAGAAALDPAAAALTAGATALAPAALSLNTGAVGLGTSSGVLQTAAAMLNAANAGLSAAALQLQAAAGALAAANAAGAASSGVNALVGAGAAGAGGMGAGPGTLAEGGPAGANLPYIVGERGPELFVPSTAGTVVPHAQTMAALANAPRQSGGSTVVNVPRPQVDVHVENHIDAGRVVSAGLGTRDGQNSFIKTISKNRTAVKKDLS